MSTTNLFKKTWKDTRGRTLYRRKKSTDLRALGMRKTSEYNSFSSAKGRCTNKKNKFWKNYGGRGIKFLFKSFKEFFDELGRKPKGTTLDRWPNSEGNYESGNVRWATRKQQAANKFVKCPHCGGLVRAYRNV